MSDSPPSSRRSVTLKMLLRFLGGYTEPRWAKDRRPQPLRSRCVVQHFRTQLRRVAVTRLRMEGKSFREISRELGISQVAAWKLWQQTMEDVAEQVSAEQEGLRLLIEAYRKRDAGDSEPLRVLFQKVTGRFGVRVAARFVGHPGVRER